MCEAENLALCIDQTVAISNALSGTERAAKVMAHIGALRYIQWRQRESSGLVEESAQGGELEERVELGQRRLLLVGVHRMAKEEQELWALWPANRARLSERCVAFQTSGRFLENCCR